MDFAIKYLSDPVCPAFGPVRSRVCPFSYMLYILLQKDFYYSVFSGICQELILHILQISAFNSSDELISYGWRFNRIVELRHAPVSFFVMVCPQNAAQASSLGTP